MFKKVGSLFSKEQDKVAPNLKPLLSFKLGKKEWKQSKKDAKELSELGIPQTK